MIIDFHTHMFPPALAPRAIGQLAASIGQVPETDGTCGGLRASMKRAGIDCSVVLPVATKPSQFQSINEFASHYLEGDIISFGGIHPDTDDYKGKLRQIRDMGMRGIKLHPDYQETYFNDIRYKRIVSYATELGLIVSVHAGYDPKCPHDIHCTPQMSAEVIDETQPDKLVLAHMGGNRVWEDVERWLVGKKIYFDTGVVFSFGLGTEHFLRMMRAHGSERILFATDCPWAKQSEFVKILRGLPITEEERERIFYKNAAGLLGLPLLQTQD